jgi:hypothetical protein
MDFAISFAASTTRSRIPGVVNRARTGLAIAPDFGLGRDRDVPPVADPFHHVIRPAEKEPVQKRVAHSAFDGSSEILRAEVAIEDELIGFRNHATAGQQFVLRAQRWPGQHKRTWAQAAVVTLTGVLQRFGRSSGPIQRHLTLDQTLALGEAKLGPYAFVVPLARGSLNSSNADRDTDRFALDHAFLMQEKSTKSS